MNWRFIAQRVTTGEFLDWDVPLTLTSNPRRDLSGPGAMVGTIDPEYARLRGDDGKLVIDEWSTVLYAEADRHIRWGGIVTGSGWSGQSWQVTCAGYTAYPHGLPYLGASIRAGLKKKNKTVTPAIDAWDVVRDIWNHVQSYPNGDIGMVMPGGESGYMLGAARDGSDPYELVWWDVPDCGDEIDTLAQEVPFDYYETHAWNGDHSAIVHRLHLDKHAGARRHDLRFVMGENIIGLAEPQRMGEAFANTILALGKGEGPKMVHTTAGHREGHLRRVAVTSHKHVGSHARLTRIARNDLTKHVEDFHVPMIQVKQHPNARIGSWQLGDTIPVDLDLPWVGKRRVWHRIIADEISLDDTVILTLAPPGL